MPRMHRSRSRNFEIERNPCLNFEKRNSKFPQKLFPFRRTQSFIVIIMASFLGNRAPLEKSRTEDDITTKENRHKTIRQIKKRDQ
jgi:hypothetical protein